jgi:hypothetical protein
MRLKIGNEKIDISFSAFVSVPNAFGVRKNALESAYACAEIFSACRRYHGQQIGLGDDAPFRRTAR